jgi:hypothetical protein
MWIGINSLGDAPTERPLAVPIQHVQGTTAMRACKYGNAGASVTHFSAVFLHVV